METLKDIFLSFSAAAAWNVEGLLFSRLSSHGMSRGLISRNPKESPP